MVLIYLQMIISFCHNARVLQTDRRTNRKATAIARSNRVGWSPASVGAQRRRQTDTSIFPVCGTGMWYEHVTPTVQRPSLAAVSGTHRIISSRLCSFTDGLASRYLSDYIQRVADSNRRRLRSSSSSQLVIRRTRVCPLSAIVRFRWLEAASGTVCRRTSPQLQR